MHHKTSNKSIKCTVTENKVILAAYPMGQCHTSSFHFQVILQFNINKIFTVIFINHKNCESLAQQTCPRLWQIDIYSNITVSIPLKQSAAQMVSCQSVEPGHSTALKIAQTLQMWSVTLPMVPPQSVSPDQVQQPWIVPPDHA